MSPSRPVPAFGSVASEDAISFCTAVIDGSGVAGKIEALLARKTCLPLYAGAAFREPKVRFVIRAARVDVPHTDDHAADAIAATAGLQAQFEAFIRQAPEQWMWAHRRWG